MDSKQVIPYHNLCCYSRNLLGLILNDYVTKSGDQVFLNNYVAPDTNFDMTVVPTVDFCMILSIEQVF